METTKTTKGPWYNPAINEGVHDAEITSVEEQEYGEDNDQMIQVALWLPEEEHTLVTNFYFPQGAGSKAAQRFWHFCRCVELEPADARYEPQLFEGRKLLIEVELANPENASIDWAYSDVRRFLPAMDNVRLV